MVEILQFIENYKYKKSKNFKKITKSIKKTIIRMKLLETTNENNIFECKFRENKIKNKAKNNHNLIIRNHVS